MFKVKSNFELKDIDEAKGIVTGYASVFGNIDSDDDMIIKGAFTKTIQEHGPESAKPRIKHLWQHSSWDIVGVPIVLKEDDKGLYFETQFGKDRFAQDKLQQHIDGLITELSIGYNTIKSENIVDGNDNFQYRKLTEVRLWEYSSVTWGANSLTEIISAKGIEEDLTKELTTRLDRLGKALKNGKYSDETCGSFEAEIEKIKSIIMSLEVKKPDNTTSSIVEPTDNEVLTSIIHAFKN